MSIRILASSPSPSAPINSCSARARWLTPAAVTQRGFGYDKTGNRTSTSDALGVATPYSYAATNHRLASAGPQARSYDAVGNPVQIGGVQLGYDERSRLAQVSLPIAQGEPPSPVWAYQYNGQGWRVAKTAGEHTTHFVYNENAQLVGEYDRAGNPTQEFIWLGNLPIGVIAQSGSTTVLHYIESDHLGTPRVIVDATRNVAIWRWNQTDDPFGESIPNADPDGDTNTFTFNLRFAGQYRDAETGWHYNVHRYYDPATGRYLESDPIGLGGGISTYGYVGAAPLSAVDPLGLWSFTVAGYWPTQAAVGPGAAIEISFERAIPTSFSFRPGMGVGVSASIDPLGGPPDPNPPCGLANSVGLIAEAEFATPIPFVGVGVEARYGTTQVSQGPILVNREYRELGEQVPLSGRRSPVQISPRIGAGVRASAGIEITRYFNNICSCDGEFP